jgi:hypothetical protein
LQLDTADLLVTDPLLQSVEYNLKHHQRTTYLSFFSTLVDRSLQNATATTATASAAIHPPEPRFSQPSIVVIGIFQQAPKSSRLFNTL